MTNAFGIYLHWPYCTAKCPYCDFNSHVRRDLTEAAYLQAMRQELAYFADMTPGRHVSSIFFGGGTPSLMAPSTAETLIQAIKTHWSVKTDAEITLEANPSSVEADRFADFRHAGINRVSLGVQSLDDEQLRQLGRLHNAAEALKAIEIANTHFDRVSFDLIYARPEQTLEAWTAELNEALSLSAGHLSLYQLTIEPGTAFHRLHAAGKLHTPADDVSASLYERTLERCELAGLPAYEISNHARPGEEARHNLLYWRYGEYAGVGPGAHGRITTKSGRMALSTERDPARWAEAVGKAGHGLVSQELLSMREQAEEMLLMGLRLREPFSQQQLTDQTGFQLPGEELDFLEKQGLIKADGAMMTVLPAGRLILNRLIGTLAEKLETANR